MFLLFLLQPDVTGVWERENGRSQIEIERTGDGSVRGQIIWYASYHEDVEAGQPDAVLGRTLLESYEPEEDRWVDGQIYDLREGRSYRSNLFLKDADTLAVQGCFAFFCRTQEWRRVTGDEIKRISASAKDLSPPAGTH